MGIDRESCQWHYNNNVHFRQVVDALAMAMDRRMLSPSDVLKAASFAIDVHNEHELIKALETQ